MKLRPILTEYEAPRRYLDGAEENFGVHIERQDGTLANTGQGFKTAPEAQLFFDGISMALRTAGVLADPLPSYSSDARARLWGLYRSWHTASASMAHEAAAYRGTRPPGSACRTIALRHARRYRLALWVLGRHEDARTVTP